MVFWLVFVLVSFFVHLNIENMSKLFGFFFFLARFEVIFSGSV